MTIISDPSDEYDVAKQAEIIDAIRDLQDNVLMIDKDNFIGTGSLIIKSSNGKFWAITASDVGGVSTSEIEIEGGLSGTTSAKRSQNPYA